MLAYAVAPLGQPNSPAKLLILDPHVKQGFASNVNVVKETIPTGMNLASTAPPPTSRSARPASPRRSSARR